MKGRPTNAGFASLFVSACLMILLGFASPALAQTANRAVDPAKSIPLDQLAPADRESVAEVLGGPTFHRRGKSDSFQCNPRLYLALVNQPLLTLALWKNLSPSPVTLREVSPGSFQGTNNNGTEVGGRFLIRTPTLHVVLSNFRYNTPRGNLHLEGRIVLVLRTAYFKEPQGEYWVRHDLEVFVKIDTRGCARLGPLGSADRREISRRPGPRRGLVRLTHEPTGRHLPELGRRCRHEPQRHSLGNSTKLPHSRLPSPQGRRLPRQTPSRRREFGDRTGPTAVIFSNFPKQRAASAHARL